MNSHILKFGIIFSAILASSISAFAGSNPDQKVDQLRDQMLQIRNCYYDIDREELKPVVTSLSKREFTVMQLFEAYETTCREDTHLSKVGRAAKLAKEIGSGKLNFAEYKSLWQKMDDFDCNPDTEAAAGGITDRNKVAHMVLENKIDFAVFMRTFASVCNNDKDAMDEAIAAATLKQATNTVSNMRGIVTDMRVAKVHDTDVNKMEVNACAGLALKMLHSGSAGD